MNFRALQERLAAFLKERVRSGELTERGLARITGVSQPHIHNVLKGKRVFSMDASDRILRRLRMDLLDLIEADDVGEWRRRREPGAERRQLPAAVPPGSILEGRKGAVIEPFREPGTGT